MRTLTRTSAVLALTAGLLTGAGAGPGLADDDAPRDNVVRAESGPDRKVVERSRVVVTTARGDVVDNGNVARAVSQDCTGCRAIAVAFQAVLVPDSRSTLKPENGAAAFNVDCVECTSAAFAYQYVVPTNGVRELSDSGEDAVERVARRVAEVTRSGLSPAEIDARLETLEAEFRAAVHAGLTGEGEGDEDDDEDEDDD